MWPLAIPPYKVQEQALEHARGKRTYGFFLEMGLGKTAVVLAEYVELRQADRVDALVVLCPNSLKGAWAEETEKMGVARALGGPPLLLVMNYEATITAKGLALLTGWLERYRVYLAIDESTQVKNPRAQRTKAVIQASMKAKYVRILSGAPVVQGPQDLWSQLRCLGLFSGMNYFVYRNTYCQLGGFMGKQVLGVKKGREAELNHILSLCAFRAKKDDWLDLPQKIYTTRQVDLNPEQQAHYVNMKRHLLTIIQGEVVNAPIVITQMLKLQQITSGFLIDEQGAAITIGGTNPKLAVVQEILEQITGKVIVFTWFRESTRLLAETLSKDYGVCVLQGGMTPEGIEEVKARFADDADCRILVCQIQTGKFGHTFLGGPGDERCATTIFYENSFSLDARIQAEDRNHRIGQDKPVVYIDLVASDMDRVVIRALQRKQDTAAAIIDYARG